MVEDELAQDEVSTGLCHAVSDGFDSLAVAGRMVIPRNVGPAVWEALQAFALGDGQAADGVGFPLLLEDEIVSAERFLIAEPLLGRGVGHEGANGWFPAGKAGLALLEDDVAVTGVQGIALIVIAEARTAWTIGIFAVDHVALQAVSLVQIGDSA